MKIVDAVKSWLAPKPPHVEVQPYFTPLVDFVSPETRSSYVKDMTYTIRPGNDRLAALAQRWHAEGKIEFKATRPPSSVKGVGGVS